MFPRAVGIRLGGFFFHYEVSEKEKRASTVEDADFSHFQKICLKNCFTVKSITYA